MLKFIGQKMKDPKKSYRPIKLRAIDDNDLSIESINEADVQTRIKAEKVVKSLT